MSTTFHDAPVAQRADMVAHLSTALTAATTLACLATLLWPDLLQGPAVMNGSAKGTALVALLVGVPLLVLSQVRAESGSPRAAVVRTGVAAYLLYNAVLLTFATPFNGAFLLYVVMLGLAGWTTIASSLALAGQVDALVGEVPRWVAVFIWTAVALNTLAWLARVVPPLFADDPTSWLDGTGLTTNPVIAQDLAVWLPLLAVLGWGVWAARPPLVALAAAGLVFWSIEGLGVAVDQWWGHHLAPESAWASPAAVVLFLVVAGATLLPARRLLRCVPADDLPRRSQPQDT